MTFKNHIWEDWECRRGSERAKAQQLFQILSDSPWNAVTEATEITAILCDLFFLKSLEGFFQWPWGPQELCHDASF